MNWASRLTGRLSFSIYMVSRSAAFVNGGGKVPAAPLQPPPRTCAIFSMSTSEASCHGRELSRAVTRRELTAEALRRPGKALRCFPSFFPGCRPVRARARSKLFCKKVSSKNFTLATARPPPRTCAILSMSTSGSELPLARIESPGTGPRTCAILSMSTSDSELPLARIDSGGTPHQFSFLLLMIFDSSSMKLLISLNCRYTEANRT